ncbi:unnamed protein product [Ophioblennius macclurei]
MAGLVVLSLTLLISLCLNVILWYKKGPSSCRDREDSCCHHVTEEDVDEEQRETPHAEREQQENPIYGNIHTERTEVCYEMMTMRQPRDNTKPDLNYASLDLKLAKKHKKQRRQQSQGRATLQDQPAVRHTPPVNSFLEVDADVDACLPSRDTSTMVSHSSIYLNSQQIALEAEEMERERSVNLESENVGWDGLRGREEERRRDGTRERRDGGTVENVRVQFPNGDALQSSTDHLMHNFDRGD